MRPLIVIAGPTAAGKSALAVSIAKCFDTEVVSADSMQVYKGMDIGTAKPSDEEMQGVPHHMISIVEPDRAFSVGEYVREAGPVIEGIYARGRIPVIAGGTGLYIRGLVDGLCDAPAADPELRKRLFGEEEQFGKGHLHKKLTEVDPALAGRIEPNDTIKIVRALEVFEKSGNPMSEIQNLHGFKESRFHPIVIGLTMERMNLYKKIEERVQNMVEQGLENEVRGLLDKYGYSAPLRNGLGYKQFAGYINGLYSRDEAISLLKRDTRRYAKRQFTWFRRDARIKWFSVKEDLSHFKEIAEEIKNKLAVSSKQ